jgi:UDP-GlcNAc:undecaprenyl-phosphate GlcNAc-1-phosphate transferase
LSGAPPFLIVAPLSFAAALLLTPVMRGLARATGYLDHPDVRKHHAEPTALLGGVAIALALLVGLGASRALFGAPIAAPPVGTLAGAALSLGLGMLDDRRPMSPLGKLAGQIAAALCLVVAGPDIPWIRQNPLVAATAIVAVVALLNAVNFLDAMDGIVAAVVPITACGFLALGLLHGAPIDLALAWGLVGAGAGFLVYNAPPARIFMGDAGSHLLGFAVATLALESIASVSPTLPHLAAAAILLAYPLFDVVFVIVTRLRRGRPVHVGSVDHTTHRLGRTLGNWGALGAVSLLVTVNTAVAVWVWGFERPVWPVATVLVFGLGYAIFGAWLGRISPTPSFDI